MAGVIDESGQQWERCNNCLEFVRIESLQYEEPSPMYSYGRDLCTRCARATPSTRNRRRLAGRKRFDAERKRYEEKLWPSKCGHPARSKDQVYHWIENPDGSSTGTAYCSNECKAIALAGGIQ